MSVLEGALLLAVKMCPAAILVLTDRYVRVMSFPAAAVGLTNK